MPSEYVILPTNVTLPLTGPMGAGAGASQAGMAASNTGALAITTGSAPDINAVIAEIDFSFTPTQNTYTVILTPANEASAALYGTQQVYVALTSTGFTINSGSVALSATTEYMWNYFVSYSNTGVSI